MDVMCPQAIIIGIEREYAGNIVPGSAHGRVVEAVDIRRHIDECRINGNVEVVDIYPLCDLV